MANHESVLYVVEVWTVKTVRRYVFRTRAAARAFAKKKEAQRNVVDVFVERATWGPDNV